MARLVETWTKGQIDRQPWQAIPDHLAKLGLTAEDGREKVWFVDENGRLSSSAEAANKALRYCWWAKPITALYHLPGIPPIEDRIYKWIAQNRHYLPGSTPSCKINAEK